MTSMPVAIAIAVVALWLSWPRAVRYLWRRRRITPTATTVLVVARAPIVLAIATLAAGGSLLIAFLVGTLLSIVGMLLFPYLREFLSDPRVT